MMTYFRLTPYEAHEVPDAIRELFAHQGFMQSLQKYFPPELLTLFMEKKDGVQSSYDFQKEMIYPLLQWIIRNTSTGITSSGLDKLSQDQKYLFVSNHRDIVLDTALMNMLLFEQGIETAQMAIGDNLIRNRLSELIFRLNKSFIITRAGTPRQLYKASVEVSKYIRDLIAEGRSSVWIAQREGRSKDGTDETQVGVLKMLGLSSHRSQGLAAHFKALRVVPVTISYEFDPCDVHKASELAIKQMGIPFQKTFQQDLEQMLLGIMGFKGHIHFHFGQPLNEELDAIDEGEHPKEKLETLKQILNKAIRSHYRLHPINYFAADQVNETLQYATHYQSDVTKLEASFNKKIAALGNEDYAAAAKDFLFQMYGNAVKLSQDGK